MTEVLAAVEYNLQNECYKKKKKSGISFANFLIKNVSHTSCECASQFYWLTGFSEKEKKPVIWKVEKCTDFYTLVRNPQALPSSEYWYLNIR